jgi:peptidoglycan hydrolase-like protein with peptidoglycan-binding domain
MTPGQSWLAIGAFAFLSLGVVINMLVLQDEAVTSAAMKAQAARVDQKAKADRLKRLAVDDAAPVPGVQLTSLGASRKTSRTGSGVPTPGDNSRVGSSEPSERLTAVSRIARLAQESARLDTPLDEPGLPSAGSEINKAVQRELARKGYDPGTQDGVPGLMTRAAIMAFEWDHGLGLTAEPSEALLQQILIQQRTPGTAGTGAQQRSRQAVQVIRTIQQSLLVLGYLQGPVDGHLGDASQRAIREFEMDNGLVPSGRISSPLLAKLARAAASGRLSAVR